MDLRTTYRLLSPLLLVACASPQESAPLLGSFRLTEQTESGEDRSVPKGIATMDVNSSIKIEARPENLPVPEAASTPVVLEDRTALRQRLEEMLAGVARFAALCKQIQEEYRLTHDERGKRLAGANFDRFDQLWKDQAFVGQEYLFRIKAYVAERLGIRGDREAIEQDLKISEFLKTHGGAGRLDRKIPFIESELKEIAEETEGRVNLLRRLGARYKIRLQARILRSDGSFTFGHLPGYDTYEAGVPVLHDRIVRKLDPETSAQLETEMKFYSKLAKQVNVLLMQGNGMFKELSQVWNAMTQDVNGLIATLRSADFDEAEEKLAQIVSRLPSPTPEPKPLTDLKAALKSLGNAVKEIKQVVRSVDRPAGRLESFPIGAVDGLWKLVSNAIQSAQDSLPAALKAVKALIDPNTELLGNLKQELERVLGAFLPNTVRALVDQEGLKAALALIKSIREGLYPAAIQSSTAGKTISGEPIDVPLDLAKSSIFELPKYARKDGDVVEISARLMDKDNKVIDEESRLIRVLTMGIHSKITASAIMVDRINVPAGASPSQFEASPSLSYTFHWTIPGNGGWAQFWNTLDLGIGGNLALLNFSGSSPEVGVGVDVSVLGNLIHGGFGYDLHASSGGEYWFVGIGLLELFKTIGGGSSAPAAVEK